MSYPFIGEIRFFAFQFEPWRWTRCDGKLLPISQNTALFSLLGTTYGGNGQTSFGLPDLRDRSPRHTGPTVALGQTGGSEAHTLTEAEIPPHGHGTSGPQWSTAPASSRDPTEGLPARTSRDAWVPRHLAQGSMHASVVGGDVPHENRQPFLAMNACIALSGIFPPFQGGGGGWPSDPFLGELRLFAGSQLPPGWSFCEGQLLPIQPNPALFSLLGIAYGGNGVTTFALPDLRGRIPIGAGGAYAVGAAGGAEQVTLGTQHLPRHAHPHAASDDWGMDTDPEDMVPAASGRALYAPPQGTFDPGPVAGGGQPHDNMAPSLVLRWAIAMQGVFPSRN